MFGTDDASYMVSEYMDRGGLDVMLRGSLKHFTLPKLAKLYDMYCDIFHIEQRNGCGRWSDISSQAQGDSQAPELSKPVGG
jgi:hypothetical protein